MTDDKKLKLNISEKSPKSHYQDSQQPKKPKIKPSAAAVVDRKAFLSALELRLAEIEENLTVAQQKQMADYYQILVETNRVMNLTGIVEAAEVAEKHIADSLRLLPYLREMQKTKVDQPLTLVDVGTGAGLPGVPLAVACPNLQVFLLESQQKRCNFLKKVIEQIHLNNAEIVRGRAEEFGNNEKYREKLDFAVARAVASMPILLEYLAPFVRVGGKIVAMKGSNIEEEMEKSQNARKELALTVDSELQYQLHSGEQRSLVILTKNNLLKKKYPRNSGAIKKKPL